MDLATIYVAVWGRARRVLAEADARAVPEIAVAYGQKNGRTDGHFYPRGVDGRGAPIIRIFRLRDLPKPGLPRAQPDPTHPAALTELCFLAHELGHVLSWRDGAVDWEALDIATGVMAQGNEAQRALVLEEEVRAWRLGREELSALGFDDWSTFGRQRAAKLRGYAQGLRLSMPD